MRLLARLLVLLIALGVPAAAEEAILAYDQRIMLDAGGRLEVTETITVRAEGQNIRRGIYRDFPLYFEDAAGRTQKVGFVFQEATLDGAEVASRLENTRSGIRIYLGDPDVFLSPGVYKYRIVYETTRQIRFFEDHDELYWNVTGNEWAFPIDKVRAEVFLPGGADSLAPPPNRATAYTGRYGETGEDFRLRETATGIAVESTRRLQAGEGLSLVAGLDKGVIAPPTEAEQFWYDHSGEILAGAALLVVLLYYLWAWNRVGRDPAKGVIIPLFSAPKGVTPALANYIHNKGFSQNGWTALSATCVDLAVKGYLIFEDLSGKVRLEPTGKARGGDLLRGEREVADWFAGQGRALTLAKSDGPRVQSLGNLHRSAIERDYRGKFYLRNGGYSAFGILLSVVAGAAVLYLGDFREEELVALPVLIFATVWLGIATAAVRGLLKRIGVPIGPVANLVFVLVVIGGALSAMGGALGLLGTGNSLQDLILPGVLAGLLAVNAVFVWLLGAPTHEGRAMMDKIEGLKMYLSVAEADRMNMAGAPEMSPTRYETLLPYAIALGVEKPWTEAFNAWLLTAAAAAGAAYQPGWYHGQNFSSGRGFSTGMADELGSMARSFASSIPAPKSSSSGFGGGSRGSGGGGGGGGGGGW